MMFDQVYIAQSFLLSCAISAVFLGAKRLRVELIRGNCEDILETHDAIMMPLTGSAVLFTLYLILQFISSKLVSLLLSVYLGVISIFVLGVFIKKYIRPSIFSGICCTCIGIYYMYTRNWVANNVLAFALAVIAIESIPIDNFKSSFALLIGLFFYDIFWVFGTEVMLKVANEINAPIKLTFPQTIIGNHDKMSIIGLGDIILPGIFIAQTLVFSHECVKRGDLYFKVSIIAYFCSLINTITVMLIFKHGQPALLFIVPWLLISFLFTVCWKGDFNAAWKFNISFIEEKHQKVVYSMPETNPQPPTKESKNVNNNEKDGKKSVKEKNKSAANKNAKINKKVNKDNDQSFVEFVLTSIQQLYGFNLPVEDKYINRARIPAPKKGAKNVQTLQEILNLDQEEKKCTPNEETFYTVEKEYKVHD